MDSHYGCVFEACWHVPSLGLDMNGYCDDDEQHNLTGFVNIIKLSTGICGGDNWGSIVYGLVFFLGVEDSWRDGCHQSLTEPFVFLDPFSFSCFFACQQVPSVGSYQHHFGIRDSSIH